jgi:hypothetical protein
MNDQAATLSLVTNALLTVPEQQRAPAPAWVDRVVVE